MTPFFITIIAVISTATLTTAAVAYIYRKKIRSIRADHEIMPNYTDMLNRIGQCEGHLRENRNDIDRFNTKVTELEEFTTRMVNKMSARSRRASTKAEEMEQMQELLRQSQELDQQSQDNTPDPAGGGDVNQRPRLVRKK